tara:strand:+ start:2474 stop:2815 length:342 start_codon:yes stop_codon:yes gene_type:complete
MLILRTINTNTANSLGINTFNKMYVTNTSSTTDAVFTLELKQTGSVSNPVEIAVVNRVTIPVGVTLELDGYKEGPVYTGDVIPNVIPLSVLLYATAVSGEVDLLIEADNITEN